MWDGDRFNIRDKAAEDSLSLSEQDILLLSNHRIHSTFDFIGWIQQKPLQNIIMVTTHPQRWTNKPMEWLQEFIMQSIKNVVKKRFIKRL